MYTLYFSPGACSLATQVILREIDQTFKLVSVNDVDDFSAINPVAQVPAIHDGNKLFTEGAAIIIKLLSTHKNSLLPESGDERDTAIENIMFANATMHPAYGRLFFIAANITDESAKQQAFAAAAESINSLWATVESKLQGTFLGGNSHSAADIMLSVYHSWGQYFPVTIEPGPKTQKMIEEIYKLPSYEKSTQAEKKEPAAA